jgi:hypothetical protein
VVPLDQDTTSVSTGDGGTVFKIGGSREVTADLVSTRNVVGDVEVSEEVSDEEGRDLAVWETFVFTGEEGQEFSEDDPPLSATHDRVVFDRHTGEAVDCCGYFTSSAIDAETGEEIRDEETPIEGQYFKLPFGAEKKTYQFWDSSLRAATDLEYQATETIDGLTVYRYQQRIEPTDVGDLPEGAGSLFGVEDPTAVIDRVYSNTRTLWVEPETGVIIRGQEAQFVTAEYDGEQVATLTDVTIGYSEDTIADNVDTYSSLSTSLKIVRVWAPLACLVLGLGLLGAGLVVLLSRGRGDSEDNGVSRGARFTQSSGASRA